MENNLKKCPICKKKLVQTEETCHNCGYEFSSKIKREQPQKKFQRLLVILIIFVLPVFVCLSGIIITSSLCAVSYFNSEDHKIKTYKNEIKKNPKNIEAHLKLAKSYKKKGKYKKATEHYNNIIDIEPNNANAYEGLGSINYSEEEYNNAIKNFKRAILLNPKLFEANYQLGNCYSKKHLYNEALKQFDIASKLKPKNVEVYNSTGNVYKLKGEYNKAINYYKKSNTLDSSNTNALNNLAYLYINTRDYKKALDYAKKSNMKSNTCYSKYLVGEAYYHLNKFDDAIIYYSKLTDCDDNHSYDSYFKIGQCYFQKEKYLDSEYYFKTSLDNRKDNKPALLALIKLYLKTNNKKNLESTIEKYLISKEYNAKSYHDIGATALSLNKFDTALKYLNTAIEKDNKIAGAYNDIGSVFYRQKMYNKSLDYYLKAYELNPKDGMILYNLAWNYRVLKNNTESNKFYEELKKADKTWTAKFEKETNPQ